MMRLNKAAHSAISAFLLVNYLAVYLLLSAFHLHTPLGLPSGQQGIFSSAAKGAAKPHEPNCTVCFRISTTQASLTKSFVIPSITALSPATAEVITPSSSRIHLTIRDRAPPSFS
jgi:hypothetical protein